MTIIFQDILIKTKRLDLEYNEGILQAHERICSWNTKTGHSINFPLITCRPTKSCARLCYGAMKGKPITWDKALLKYLRVYKYFKETPPRIVARRISIEYDREKMSFLRWNGVGDLFQESVDVINAISEIRPDMVLWVVTRKPEMAALINREASNVYVMFSLDGDHQSLTRKQTVDLLYHPRIYYSFLREDMNEDTLGARIIFNIQQKKGKLINDDPKTVCPADADEVMMKDACINCRRCFSPIALDGRHHLQDSQIFYGAQCP